jgi:hypothetical protein
MQQSDFSAKIYGDLEEKSMRGRSEISPADHCSFSTNATDDAQEQIERGIELLRLTSQNREQQHRSWDAAIPWKTSFMIIPVRR